jgi:prefoldin subunit 5
MASERLNEEQLHALMQLNEAVAQAQENILSVAESNGYNLRASARKPAGFYKGMEGGAVCDNKYVRLAINAAIVLGMGGMGYMAGSVLSFYTQAYGLGPVFESLLSSIVQMAGTLGEGAIHTAPSMASAAASATSSAASAVASGVSGAFNILSSMGQFTATAAPVFAAGRYIGTGLSASEDYNNTIAKLEASYDALKSHSGAVTRSMSAKMESLKEQIEALKTKGSETQQGISNVASSVEGKYTEFITKICAFLDDPAGIGAAVEEGLSAGLGGGRRRKQRKSRKHHKGGKKHKKSAKKHHKKSHKGGKKHHKKSVKKHHKTRKSRR